MEWCSRAQLQTPSWSRSPEELLLLHPVSFHPAMTLQPRVKQEDSRCLGKPDSVMEVKVVMS